MQLTDLKAIFRKELCNLYPKEEIDTFFNQLLEHYLNLERFVFVLQPQLTLTKDETQPLFEALAQLKLEKPLQYITGVAYFMDLEFRVNPNVLIPRPETEELVRWAMDTPHFLFNNTSEEKKGAILDIGTGSGCIAIALARKFPNVKVYALDSSKKALEVARENALAHQVNVTFYERDILQHDPSPELDLVLNSDLKLNSELDLALNSELEPELELEPALSSKLKFDIIIANPPYVRESEKKEIQNNVKQYEPEKALFVPDDRPLVFYEAIAAFAKKHLNQNGYLYLEINQYLASQTQEVLEDLNFDEIELRKDIFGNFRMLKGRVSR